MSDHLDHYLPASAPGRHHRAVTTLADPTQGDILAYGKTLLGMNPALTRDELRALLEAKFIHGEDILRTNTMGAIADPWDWLRGLGLIATGIALILKGKKSEKADGIKKIIEGVVTILKPGDDSGAAK